MDSLELKALRQAKGLTQAQASRLLTIPLRTYKNYENDPHKRGSIKYQYALRVLQEYNRLDEEHGILTLEEIQAGVNSVLQEDGAEYGLLFGSYSRGEASPVSDVDLLIDTPTTGLEFYGLVEKLRQTLHKKVDLVTVASLKNNDELTKAILHDGIRIYEKHQRQCLLHRQDLRSHH
jgi:predicted nucleotidyltransferase/DNA-binding XRE family transcriptional regulator